MDAEDEVMLSANTPENLLRDVVEWLETQRERWRAAAEGLGFPLTVEQRVPVLETKEDGSDEGSLRSIQMSTATVQEMAWAIGGTLQSTDTPRLADLLYDAYGQRAHVWSPLLQPDFSEDPAEHITRSLLNPLRQDYLKDLESLAEGNDTLAKNLASELLALLDGEELVFVTALPIVDFRTSR